MDMNLDNAIEILEHYVKTDRVMRDYNDTTDYEQFCEKRCIAIEAVLKELDKKKCTCPTKLQV